jgi:hypothetical protein
MRAKPAWRLPSGGKIQPFLTFHERNRSWNLPVSCRSRKLDGDASSGPVQAVRQTRAAKVIGRKKSVIFYANDFFGKCV